MPGKRMNLQGQRFGRLLVTEFDHAQLCPKSVRSHWKCRCDCGKETVVRSDDLRAGDNVSCGCKKIDQLTEHGGTGTPEHKVWCSMIERCHTPTHRNFSDYGGRGIKVCDAWRASFAIFLCDVGVRPSSKHSIDRYPNNNGNYEPTNIRWATRSQQLRNTRRNRIIVIEGQKLCVAEAAEKYGKSYKLVFNRISRGWSPERAVGLVP